MIRDIGQRDHEKRRKSGIVRGRGKAGGGGVKQKELNTKKSFVFFVLVLATPPPPGLALPGLLMGLQKP